MNFSILKYLQLAVSCYAIYQLAINNEQLTVNNLRPVTCNLQLITCNRNCT